MSDAALALSTQSAISYVIIGSKNDGRSIVARSFDATVETEDIVTMVR